MPYRLRSNIISRRANGEPIFPKPPSTPLFLDRRASGHCRGFLGGASNCLLVSVTDHELWITPAFPFNIVGPYGRFGLDYRIPTSAVASAKLRRSWLGHNVRLELRRPGGENRVVDLRVRNPAALISALSPKGTT